MLYGGRDKFGAGIHFPGGKTPRVELAGVPDRIKPLVDVMAEAGELASKIMRGKTTIAADPIPAPVTAETATESATTKKRTPTEAELETLIKQQMELAQDVSPAGEQAYAAVIADIARVSLHPGVDNHGRYRSRASFRNHHCVRRKAPQLALIGRRRIADEYRFFKGNADTNRTSSDVRYWPLADISLCTAYVRFRG